VVDVCEVKAGMDIERERDEHSCTPFSGPRCPLWIQESFEVRPKTLGGMAIENIDFAKAEKGQQEPGLMFHDELSSTVISEQPGGYHQRHGQGLFQVLGVIYGLGNCGFICSELTLSERKQQVLLSPWKSSVERGSAAARFLGDISKCGLGNSPAGDQCDRGIQNAVGCLDAGEGRVWVYDT